MAREIEALEQDIVELRQQVQRLEQIVAELNKQVSSGKPELKNIIKPETKLEKAAADCIGVEKKRKRVNAFNEQKLAGTWFNRLGIVAIVLALGFFLKWSFDNHLVGELGRVVIGIVCGLSFLGLGEYFQRRKFFIYGQSFSGGGIAILYFSVFAAFSFYHLISQSVAFGFMVVNTAAAALLAVKNDSMAIGILGIAGGFVTPFVLSDGSSNMLVLFTYVAILDLGVLLVAYYKKWNPFNLLTFLFTYVTFAIWYIDQFTFEETWISLGYLTLFFAVYLGVSFVRNIRGKEKVRMTDAVLILQNAALYFLFAYILLESRYEAYMGFFAAFLSLIYILLGNMTYKLSHCDSKLSLIFLGVAAGFITLAIPLQLNEHWIAIAWALEAAILMWLGFRLHSLKGRLAGAGVMVLALGYLLAEPIRITGKEVLVLLSHSALGYIAIIALLAVILVVFSREKLEPTDEIMAKILKLVLNLLVIIFLTQEIQAYYNFIYPNIDPENYVSYVNAKNLTLSIVWGLHAAVLILLGFIRKLKNLRLFGLGYMGVVVLKVFFFDLSNLDTPHRILSFIVLGLILLAVSWVYQRYKHVIGGGGVNKNENS